jgi:peptidoglycan LD-endopeptidase LytH
MQRSKRLTFLSVLFGAIFFAVLFRLPKSSPARRAHDDSEFTPGPVGAPVASRPAMARLGSSHAGERFSSDDVPEPGGDIAELRKRNLLIPVVGVQTAELRDSFDERRGTHPHEAIDILAPRGTEVLAVEDGVVKKLFNSVPGGLTLYEFDPAERYRYSYAHLDSFAEGMAEGRLLKRGDRVGSVGTTGNAPRNTPHLHFTIARLGSDKKWWEGTPINPYLVFR